MPSIAITRNGRTRYRYIPQDSIPVEHPDQLGIAYVYRCGSGYAAVAYKGKSTTASFHYSYKTIEKAHEAIEQFFGGLTGHAERVKDYRRQAYAPHIFKVGDIVTNSWGYDQTNVDWYRVTKASAHFVWLQPIMAHVEENSFMAGTSVPHVDTGDADPKNWGFRDAKGGVEMHKAYDSHVRFKYGSGSKWDGRPLYTSWYA